MSAAAVTTIEYAWFHRTTTSRPCIALKLLGMAFDLFRASLKDLVCVGCVGTIVILHTDHI
eukprot:2276641-Amphidinium_carterae.1